MWSQRVGHQQLQPSIGPRGDHWTMCALPRQMPPHLIYSYHFAGSIVFPSIGSSSNTCLQFNSYSLQFTVIPQLQHSLQLPLSSFPVPVYPGLPNAHLSASVCADEDRPTAKRKGVFMYDCVVCVCMCGCVVCGGGSAWCVYDCVSVYVWVCGVWVCVCVGVWCVGGSAWCVYDCVSVCVCVGVWCVGVCMCGCVVCGCVGGVWVKFVCMGVWCVGVVVVCGVGVWCVWCVGAICVYGCVACVWCVWVCMWCVGGVYDVWMWVCGVCGVWV